MKTATLPSIRVEPEFRHAVESMLHNAETLTEFVENAVRETVLKRKTQTEFLRRGIAAIEATKEGGRGISADVVIAGLAAKLAAARRGRSQRKG